MLDRQRPQFTATGAIIGTEEQLSADRRQASWIGAGQPWRDILHLSCACRGSIALPKLGVLGIHAWFSGSSVEVELAARDRRTKAVIDLIANEEGSCGGAIALP